MKKLSLFFESRDTWNITPIMTWTILSTITYNIWQGFPHNLYLLETVIVRFYIFRNSTMCVINSLVSFPKTSKMVQLTIFMKLKKTFQTFLFPIWEMLYWKFERFLPKNALSWLILELDFFWWARILPEIY